MKCGNCKSQHDSASEVRACYTTGSQPHIQPHETGFTLVQHPDRTPCTRCLGTGLFITTVENGKPTGPGGICFRCKGKGYQTSADERRNWGYDTNCGGYYG